jgi:hypothetical protein
MRCRRRAIERPAYMAKKNKPIGPKSHGEKSKHESVVE